MEHPDFINGGANLIKAAGYTIVEDNESGDVFWQSPTGERCHTIRHGWVVAMQGKGPTILGTANDRFVRMVEEVQAHNDDLKSKKAREHTEETKKHLHEGIKKIKSQGIL